jgi:hypothetical protein
VAAEEEEEDVEGVAFEKEEYKAEAGTSGIELLARYIGSRKFSS